MGILRTLVIASVLCWGTAVVAEAPKGAAAKIVTELPNPRDEISSTINGIIDIVKGLPSDSQTHERRAKLREFINPKFDFAKMAQLSLGANWNTVTPEQQKEFVEIFSNLLAKTYLAKIETVKENMVTVEAASVDPQTQRATVKTLVKNKGDVFPIDYKLSSESGSWQVYDVVIENIGLVVNYRNEFAGIIRKENVSGLIERLKAKTAG